MTSYKKNIIGLLFILLLIQLSSCKVNTMGYPIIFRAANGLLYNDIIIQGNSDILTEYASAIQLHVVSTWSMNGDTIIAIPKIEYGSSKGSFWYHQFDVSDSTVTSIKKTYIMKGNKLEDITDYSPILISIGLPLQEEPTKPIEYYRIK